MRRRTVAAGAALVVAAGSGTVAALAAASPWLGLWVALGVLVVGTVLEIVVIAEWLAPRARLRDLEASGPREPRRGLENLGLEPDSRPGASPVPPPSASPAPAAPGELHWWEAPRAPGRAPGREEPAPSAGPIRGVPAGEPPAGEPDVRHLWGPVPATQSRPARERWAWPRLACPDEVVTGENFTLTVGLAEREDTAVYGTGLIRLPVAEFWLDIEIQAKGFVIVAGQRQFRLRVSRLEPFPTTTLLLAATADPEFHGRRIGVLFTVEGELRGYAVRDVSVKTSPDEPDSPHPRRAPLRNGDTARDLDALCNGSGGAPDLTIMITKDPKQPTTLTWSAVSPLVKIPRTPEPPTSDLGDPAKFLGEIVRQASEATSVEHGFSTICGFGRTIAQQVPEEIIDAIRAVADRCQPGPPVVLLATQDPYVPWELAVFDPPIGEAGGQSPFFGAQAVIGRWPLPRRPPPARCAPRSVAVRDRAVVTGVYVGVPGWKQLLEAEEEARSLLEQWPSARKIPASFREVRDCLGGDPPVDVLHFALHGKFDDSGARDGLVLIGHPAGKPDKNIPEILSAYDVRGGSLKLRAPLVFLNACQVGASREVLGDYAGMAEAFLFAGASAVVAPLWSIDDGVARSLALTFYRTASGLDAKPPAQILQEERAKLSELTVRAEPPASLTSLGYQFFGHPRFRLAYTAAERIKDA